MDYNSVHLHGEKTGEVNFGDGLGSLAALLPHAAPSVFGQLWLLGGFHQMPQLNASFLAIIQHWRLWWAARKKKNRVGGVEVEVEIVIIRVLNT